MCWPMPNSKPPLCHHVHWRMTGSTYGSASPPSLAAMLRAKPAQDPQRPGLLVAGGGVGALDPLARRRRRTSTSDAAIEAMPTSVPFIGRRLPNRMMTKKATPG